MVPVATDSEDAVQVPYTYDRQAGRPPIAMAGAAFAHHDSREGAL